MGIGPEFIRREIVANGVSGTLDGVPTERMDRTPSSPIVVEQQAVAPPPAATMRIPIPTPARTVQISLARKQIVEPANDGSAPAGKPSLRLDSMVSGRFFQEGEQQEASGWEDSPLASEPLPEDEPPKVSSFDRVPRHRGPLIVTTFLLGIALVIGFAVKGTGAIASARTLLAGEAGARAVGVWNRAKSGLALHLTPESTAASAQAMAAPAQPVTAPAVTAPAVAPPASAAPVPSVAVAVPPGVQPVSTVVATRQSPPRVVRPPLALAHRAKSAPVPSRATEDEGQSAPAVAAAAANLIPAGAVEDATAQAAPETEPRPAEATRRAESPRRGLVWSPSQQRLVPAQAAGDAPATDAPTSDTPVRAADPDSTPKSADKDVLPLDDQAHTTY